MDLFENKPMNINLHQQKLISNPLRIKIIYLLAGQSLTAKQVADQLGCTAGSIHYHIQQLYKGGILELERTQENKGIIEKYYRSKATQFNLNQGMAASDEADTHSRGTILSLTATELEEFENELNALFIKYLKNTIKSGDHTEARTSYEIMCSFRQFVSEENK